MPTLSDAIALAAKAHSTQTDKAGQPYILHPIRVMLRMKTDDARMAAVLHDVVEDTDVTLDDLRAQGYPEEVVAAVDAVSRREAEGETYDAFVERSAQNPLAVQVKLGDLADNMSPERADGRTEKKDRKSVV